MKLEWDLVTRLREGRTNGSHQRWMVCSIHLEAAAEIERLRDQCEAYASETGSRAIIVVQDELDS